jgi:hypothetical protein
MFTTVLMIGLIGQLPSGLKMPLQGKKQEAQQTTKQEAQHKPAVPAAPAVPAKPHTVIPPDLGKAIQMSEPPAPTEPEIGSPMARRIHEAYCQASAWSWGQSLRLFEGRLDEQFAARGKLHLWVSLRTQCHDDLFKAACAQVAKAYNVTMETLESIGTNPMAGFGPVRAERLPGETEADVARLKPVPFPVTRFDPKKVRLPEKLAKRYGYKNP